MLKKIAANKIFRNTYLILLLVVVFGLALRLTFFSGMGISDDLVYSKTAHDLLEGKGIDPNSTLTLSTRLGLIYPTALFYKILGVNDVSSVLFPLLTSIASIILIFYFGKLLFNEKIGLIAAFLLSFFPLDVVYATKLNSDLPSAFFMALGVYIFLHAELKKEIKYGLSCLFSGIFIGIGYMIRESALLIALFFIVYILPKKKIKKEYFLVPVGVIMIFIAESSLFMSLTGDPLFRSNASQGYLEEAMSIHNYFGRLDFPTGLLHYPWLFLTNNLLSFFYIFIFIAVIYLLYHKRKETYEMMFWLIPLLLYLSFGSASLTSYIPFRAVDRYTSIFTIPAILLLTVFLNEKKEFVKNHEFLSILENRKFSGNRKFIEFPSSPKIQKIGIFKRIKKWAMPLALIVLLTSSIAVVYFREDRGLLDNLRQLYPFIEKLDKIIYIDSRSLLALNYISKYSDNANIKEYTNDLSNIKNSYVVINKEMIRNLMEANAKTAFPKEISNHPKAWQVVKEIGKEDKNKITVYYTQ